MSDQLENSPALSEPHECSYRPPAKVEDIPMDEPLALFDLDGTLTIPGSQLVIERFINNEQYQFGISERRLELKQLFEAWNRESKEKINIKKYENYLKNVGNAYAQMCRGQKRGSVVQAAQGWFSNEGNSIIEPYSCEVIERVKESGARPVLITGAPFELAHCFAESLGIEHVFAMEADVDDSDAFTGHIKPAKNIGLHTNKVETRKSLSDAMHPIIFAMGDTGSDIPLLEGAIGLHDFGDNVFDVNGQAVLINPSPDLEEGANHFLRIWIDDSKLHLIPERRRPHAVVKAVRFILSDVFEENGKRMEMLKKFKEFREAA